MFDGLNLLYKGNS